jgi:hypothetical protein
MITVAEVEALREELAAANTELGLRRSRKVLNLELEAKVDKLEAVLASGDPAKEPIPKDLCANCEHNRASHNPTDLMCDYVGCNCAHFETTEEHIDRMTAAIDPIGAARARGSGQSIDPRASDRVKPPVPQPARPFFAETGRRLTVGRVCQEAPDLPQTRAELFQLMSGYARGSWELLAYEERWDLDHYYCKLTGRSVA